MFSMEMRLPHSGTTQIQNKNKLPPIGMHNAPFTISRMAVTEYKPEDSPAKVRRQSGEDLSILDMLDRSELGLDDS